MATDFTPTPIKSVSKDFMQVGNCRDLPPGDFFPERGETKKMVEAKAVCAGCQVREECLEYALAEPIEKFGVWGGLSEKQRRHYRSRTTGSVTSFHGTVSRAVSGCKCASCQLALQRASA